MSVAFLYSHAIKPAQEFQQRTIEVYLLFSGDIVGAFLLLHKGIPLRLLFLPFPGSNLNYDRRRTLGRGPPHEWQARHQLWTAGCLVMHHRDLLIVP